MEKLNQLMFDNNLNSFLFDWCKRFACVTVNPTFHDDARWIFKHESKSKLEFKPIFIVHDNNS